MAENKGFGEPRCVLHEESELIRTMRDKAFDSSSERGFLRTKVLLEADRIDRRCQESRVLQNGEGVMAQGFPCPSISPERVLSMLPTSFLSETSSFLNWRSD